MLFNIGMNVIKTGFLYTMLTSADQPLLHEMMQQLTRTFVFHPVQLTSIFHLTQQDKLKLLTFTGTIKPTKSHNLVGVDEFLVVTQRITSLSSLIRDWHHTLHILQKSDGVYCTGIKKLNTRIINNFNMIIININSESTEESIRPFRPGCSSAIMGS